jgi:carboxyl-terminal processing protease
MAGMQSDKRVSFTPSEIKTSQPKSKNNFLGPILALVLAAGSFATGYNLNQFTEQSISASQPASIFSFFRSESKSAPDTSEADLSEFWRVWHLMDQKFIAASSTDEVSAEDKINGAIKGMVAAYDDPYTVFLPPVESAAFAEDISGNFSGIGMEVGLREGVITIIAPLPDTPADRAGLRSGDLILKIDGDSTEGMRIDEAVKRIRGDKGTTVTLSIYREGELEVKEVAVIRDTIDIPTVKTEMVDDTFVISLYSFNALAEMKMQEALREYVESGAKNMVLDLRGNPGGYLQSAVAIAGYFLPTGKVVVREQYREGSNEKLYRSQGRTLREFAPDELVVLIDGGSASASEILAGALREHGVAKLVGTDTFGKGSVQELVELQGGSSVKITVARWLTPNGTSISDGGLKPDYEVVRTAEQREKDEDPQLEAALNLIKNGSIAE